MDKFYSTIVFIRLTSNILFETIPTHI